jgi:SagB-type dehydrogenase family enzyme
MARYGARATRYVFMEIGHIGQNIQLQAVALGYDSVCVGAFQDERVKSLLSLPTSEEPLYIIPIGKKR